MPGDTHAWPKSAACWSPATPLTGTPAMADAAAPRSPRTTPNRPHEGADVGERGAGHAEDVAQLVGPGPLAYVVEQGPRGVGGVGGEDPAVGSPGEVPDQPGVDRGEHEVVGDRHPAGARAATPSSCPRSRGRGRARCAPAPRGGGPRPAARRIARRSAGPATRWPGAGAGRVARSQATTVSRWLVMPMAATVSPASCRRRGHLRHRGHDAVPDLDGVVLDPSGAGVVLGELAVRDVDDGPGLVHGQRPDTGRPRIDGDHAGHGRRPYRGRPGSAPVGLVRRRARAPGANLRERVATRADGGDQPIDTLVTTVL